MGAMATFGIAVGLLLCTVVYVFSLDRHHVDTADYLAAYAAGNLVRGGEVNAIYDHSRLAPIEVSSVDAQYCVPQCPFFEYHWLPGGAIVAAPLSSVDVAASFRLWNVLQLLCLIAAAVLALRSAPWRSNGFTISRAASGVAALAGVGTFFGLFGGQGDGFGALGVAVLLSQWNRRPLFAGAFFGAMAMVAKPNPLVGLGIFVVILGLRKWRLLVGFLGALVVFGLSYFVLLGTEGIRQFAANVVSNADVFTTQSVGISSFILQNVGRNGVIAGYVLDLVPLVLCALFAWKFPTDERKRAWVLVAVVMLSVLGDPHGLWQDFEVLIPAMVWLFALTTQFHEGAASPELAVSPLTGWWLAANFVIFMIWLHEIPLFASPAALLLTVATGLVTWQTYQRAYRPSDVRSSSL